MQQFSSANLVLRSYQFVGNPLTFIHRLEKLIAMHTHIKVRGFHIDVFQHVNNARYLEFLEEAVGNGWMGNPYSNGWLSTNCFYRGEYQY